MKWAKTRPRDGPSVAESPCARAREGVTRKQHFAERLNLVEQDRSTLRARLLLLLAVMNSRCATRALNLSGSIERLHAEGARAYAGEIARHGWHKHHAPDVSARTFWTIALGVALEGHATGRSTAAHTEDMHKTLGKLAETLSVEDPPEPH